MKLRRWLLYLRSGINEFMGRMAWTRSSSHMESRLMVCSCCLPRGPCSCWWSKVMRKRSTRRSSDVHHFRSIDCVSRAPIQVIVSS